MSKAFDLLSSVLRELAAAAASGAAYPSWDDGFARKEIREVWADEKAPLRKPRNGRVTVEELNALSPDQRQVLGFGNWDDKLVLIPLWAFNYIQDGAELVSIDGEKRIKGAQTEFDLDQRFGCIAWGFEVSQ